MTRSKGNHTYPAREEIDLHEPTFLRVYNLYQQGGLGGLGGGGVARKGERGSWGTHDPYDPPLWEASASLFCEKAKKLKNQSPR